MSIENLVSASEFARKGNIPNSRFWPLVKAGKVKPVKVVGRVKLFDLAELPAVVAMITASQREVMV